MNGEKRLLLGTVLSIQSSTFTYPACQNCFSRLIHAHSRYECQRCGSVRREATQRYKLCVKVAEDQDVHIITVFGRCLEKVFGTSAESLHRHLLGSSHPTGHLDSDKAQELLVQAAEYCLIGRRVTFPVKIPGDLGRGNSVCLSDSQRTMVACQIILPEDDPTGCTILNHFSRLVENELSNSLMNSRTELSADVTRRDWGLLESGCSPDHSRNTLGNYWQQSLGLSLSPLVNTSSESLCNTPGRPSPRESQRLIAPPPVITGLPGVGLNSSNPSPKDSFLNAHKVLSNRTGFHHPPGFSPARHAKLELGKETCLQSNCNAGRSRSQSRSASHSQNVAAATHQDEEETWDDFPFSESLNEILAEADDREGAHSSRAENPLPFSLDTEEARESHCRELSDVIKTPDATLRASADTSGNETFMKNLTQHSLDLSSDYNSHTLVLNCSRNDSKTDDTTLPSERSVDDRLSGDHQGSIHTNSAHDVICKGGFTGLPPHQNTSLIRPHVTGSPPDENALCGRSMFNISIKGVKNLNTFVISLVKGGFNDNSGVRNEISTWQDVALGELSVLRCSNRVHNVSSDLFDSRSNMEEASEGILQSEHAVSEGNRLSGYDSPCTDVSPYRRQNINYKLDNYEMADCDFHPSLQSTPVLRRLSEAGCLTIGRHRFTYTSQAYPSVFSIGRRSNHSLVKTIKPERKSALLCSITDNFPLLYSPISSSSSIAEVSLKTLQRRVSKSFRRKMSLGNKENYGMGGLQNSSNDDCMLTESHCTNGQGEMDKTDALDGTVKLSPRMCSPQRYGVQVYPMQNQLPIYWSPELFTEKSNVSQPGDDIQRRLF